MLELKWTDNGGSSHTGTAARVTVEAYKDPEGWHADVIVTDGRTEDKWPKWIYGFKSLRAVKDHCGAALPSTLGEDDVPTDGGVDEMGDVASGTSNPPPTSPAENAGGPSGLALTGADEVTATMADGTKIHIALSPSGGELIVATRPGSATGLALYPSPSFRTLRLKPTRDC